MDHINAIDAANEAAFEAFIEEQRREAEMEPDILEILEGISSCWLCVLCSVCA